MNEIPFASLTPVRGHGQAQVLHRPDAARPGHDQLHGTLYPADTNSCSDYDQFYEYEGHGQWKLLEGWTN